MTNKITTLFARFSQNRFFSTEHLPPLTNRYTERVVNSLEYGPLLKKPDLLFHGIFSAIWKIPSILENGILSKRAAEKNNIQLPFNFGTEKDFVENGSNGNDFISCARSPSHPDARGLLGAFGYIKQGIAFVIHDVSPEPLSSHLGIAGEAFVDWKIPPTKIGALVISENLIETPISEINFLEGGTDEVFHLRCQFLAKYLKNEYGIKDAELETKTKQPIQEGERELIEQGYNQLLKNCIATKFDLNEPRGFLKLVRSFAPSHLRLFDSKGFPL